jgi:hypothetical protein
MRTIKAGNYVGWPMLTEQNVSKYYPKLDETLKGHMNQARKNVRSTKVKIAPLELAEYPAMRGKKVQDIYISTYEVCKTTFFDQTGQFPTRSKSGNKYIMIMVEINSSAICVCVCVLASGYGWGTVMYEIPISSPSLDDVPSIP